MRVYLIAAGGQAPPDAPTSLTATAVSASRIDLSWTNNATSYDGTKIERSTDGVNFTEITDVASGVSTYASTGLSASTQYYYRVRAYKGTLNSAYSNTADATTQPAQVERIIEIDTTKTETGSTASNQFRLAVSGGTNINIDWGDSTTDTGVTSSITHTYAVAGVYDVKITGTISHSVGNITANDRLKYANIKQWGSGVIDTSFAYSFFGCRFMDFTATDAPANISNVTSMAYAFNGCRGLTLYDFSAWDVSSVTDFSFLFNDCIDFNGNVTTWDVSSGTQFQYMFAYNYVFNQNISTWNTSNATNMSNMFFEANVFNQDLSSWNVGNVTNFSSMFRRAYAFNQNIGAWDVSKATNMSYLFEGSIGAKTVFNQDISSWNTGSVTDMRNMFSNSNFNQPIGTWNTGNVTTMASMFQRNSVFNQNIGTWNVSKVTSMANMFTSATAFNQDLSSWDVGNVTSFSQMFDAATGMLSNTSIASWNIGSSLTSSSTITFNSMFLNLNYNVDLTSWNMIRASTITSMFFSGRNNNNYGLWDIRNVSSGLNFQGQATPSTISATTLANMYIGWATQPVRPISISFGTAKYDASGASARAILTATRAVSVTGAGDPLADGTYTWNGSRYENANGYYFSTILVVTQFQWRVHNSLGTVLATGNSSFPSQNNANPASSSGWSGAWSGMVITMTGAGWTITDGGQL